MTLHAFTPALLMDSGEEKNMAISFDYVLPEYHRNWHDPFLGSLFIVDVLDTEKKTAGFICNGINSFKKPML